MTPLTPLQVLTEKWSIDKYNLRIIVELLDAQIAEREGMRKNEDDIEIPTGANIGEYHFVEKLKREGHNLALSEMNKRDEGLLQALKQMV